MVEATPISGPALMWTPQCDSLQIDEPTVFVMPIVRAPCGLQYLQKIHYCISQEVLALSTFVKEIQ